VVDDELPAASEKVAELALPVCAFENVVLFESHHGQPPAFGGDAIIVLREFLLVCEMLTSGVEPFSS
jgi:hypothetical protein